MWIEKKGADLTLENGIMTGNCKTKDKGNCM